VAVVKFHEKNKALFLGLQAGSGSVFKLPTGTGTLSTVTATVGASPVFSFTAAAVYVGMPIVLSGTNSNCLLTGYVAGTTYYVIGISTTSTLGVTGITLSATRGGTSVVTTGTAGTTGLTYTYSSLSSIDAFACTEITSDPTRDTGSFTYLGDSLSRDEYTYTKDVYIDLGATTYQQNIVSGTTAKDVNTDSIWKAFQLCGGNVIVNATTKEIFVDNATDSPDYGTADVRFSSPDDPTNDKVYKFWDLRGTVDISGTVGDIPSLKFSLKGNVDDPIAYAKQSASVTTQVTNVAPAILPSTVVQARLLDISTADAYATALSTPTASAVGTQVTLTVGAHSLTIGDIVRLRVAGITTQPTIYNGDFVGYVLTATTIMYYAKGGTTSGALSGTITVNRPSALPSVAFCFSTLTAANFFGFDLQRYLTGCDQGFAKGAAPTDVAVTMLEDQVGGTSFNPDANISKFYAAVLRFGNLSGGAPVQYKTIAYAWDKLQLANVKEGKVGSYMGRDVTFRNTGSSYIYYQ
jgi:hypothetical protein